MSRALRLFATLVLLALVLWFVAPGEVMAALRGLHAGWLALAVAGLGAQIVLSALRWALTARALGLEVRQGWAVQEYGLSVASNTFLPGGVLGDLARILRARHLGWRMATASVVIERLAGQVALGLIALVGLTLWLGALRAGLVLGVLVVGTLVLVRTFPDMAGLVRRAWTGRDVWPGQLGLSALILACNLLGFWAAARAVGVALPPVAALGVIPLTLLSMLVPLTINGWGLREGVAAALWPLFGVATAQAVAASLAFGLACMAAAGLGLLPWLLRGVRPAPASPDGQSAAPSRGRD